MIALVLASVLAWQGSADITNDPAYKELSKLVGGRWESPDGQGFKVVNRFRFEVGGKLIQSDGSVTVNGKVVLFIHANIGWDKATKSVFYVDVHDNDTVYTGHVALVAGTLIYDFEELHDRKAHHVIKMKFIDDDHYEAGDDGQTLKMARVKD